ncbi:MAG: enoyl-CoA hydratase/isomerase family protein [Candidatus Eiseniibacteriota bacterium]
MSFERIRFRSEGGTALLTVDRPAVRNALDHATVREIHDALDRLEADRSIRVMIVTGAGDQVFVSGADVNTLLARTTRETLDAANNRLFSRLENFALPTIAAINGWALGGGLELALACDLRIASESAKMGLPETSLGIIPGAGGTHRLPRLVGIGVAKEMILAGTILDAAEALRVGLVNRVVPQAELLPAARELAARIQKRAPLATELAKASLNAAGNVPVEFGMAFDRVAQTVLNATADKREGMTAFLEKRTPEFRGE